MAEEAIPVGKIAEVIGRVLDVPVLSKSSKESAKLFSWLTPFIEADNPVSSRLTRRKAGVAADAERHRLGSPDGPYEISEMVSGG